MVKTVNFMLRVFYCNKSFEKKGKGAKAVCASWACEDSGLGPQLSVSERNGELFQLWVFSHLESPAPGQVPALTLPS